MTKTVIEVEGMDELEAALARFNETTSGIIEDKAALAKRKREESWAFDHKANIPPVTAGKAFDPDTAISMIGADNSDEHNKRQLAYMQALSRHIGEDAAIREELTGELQAIASKAAEIESGLYSEYLEAKGEYNAALARADAAAETLSMFRKQTNGDIWTKYSEAVRDTGGMSESDFMRYGLDKPATTAASYAVPTCSPVSAFTDGIIAELENVADRAAKRATVPDMPGPVQVYEGKAFGPIDPEAAKGLFRAVKRF